MKVLSFDVIEKYYMIRHTSGYLKNGVEILCTVPLKRPKIVSKQKDGDTYTLHRAKIILEKLESGYYFDSVPRLGFYIVLIELKETKHIDEVDI